MNKLKLTLAAGAVLMTVAASAAPHVQVEKVQQRYPWNGLVDVTYHVYDTDATHAYDFALAVTAGGVTKNVTVFGPTDPGQYTVTFDAANAGLFPETFAKGCSLKVLLTDKGAKTGAPANATGEAVGIVRDVMVIVIDKNDAANAADTSSYAVLYYTGCDIGKFNCDYYKEKAIVLAKVPAGRYAIGQTAAGDQNETITGNPRRTCATKGFYIGLFEVTQWQYMTVTEASVPSYWSTNGKTLYDSDTAAVNHWHYPVESVTWNALRDSTAPGDAVTPAAKGGFIARLLAKAKVNGVPLTGIDLPTAAQWEIAARAGSETFYFWGNHLRNNHPLDLNVQKVFAKYGWSTLDDYDEDDPNILTIQAEIGMYKPTEFGYGYAWCPYLTAAEFPGVAADWIGDAAGSQLSDPEYSTDPYWNANRIHAVGYAKRPNAFGLYDCYDNIRELCRDAAASGATYGEKYAENPVVTGTQRVVCGWSYAACSTDVNARGLSPSWRETGAANSNGRRTKTTSYGSWTISDQGFRLSVTLP